MKVDVVLLPKLISDEQLKGRMVVVFDVLRATTTMTAALEAGIREIRIFGDTQSAREAAAKFEGKKLLCGEEKTLPPAGFDLGNSPGQFNRSHEGFTAFMSTTNGTKAIVAARSAEQLFVGALVNAAAVAQRVAQFDGDVTLLCSGTQGSVSEEDLLGAGAVLSELQQLTQIDLESDGCRIALHLFLANRDRLYDVLFETQGGHNIRKVRLDKDIEFASRLNAFDVVGEVRDGPLRVVRHISMESARA